MFDHGLSHRQPPLLIVLPNHCDHMIPSGMLYMNIRVSWRVAVVMFEGRRFIRSPNQAGPPETGRFSDSDRRSRQECQHGDSRSGIRPQNALSLLSPGGRTSSSSAHSSRLEPLNHDCTDPGTSSTSSASITPSNDPFGAEGRKGQDPSDTPPRPLKSLGTCPYRAIGFTTKMYRLHSDIVQWPILFPLTHFAKLFSLPALLPFQFDTLLSICSSRYTT